MTHSWSSKFVAIIFSFIPVIHSENCYSMGIGINLWIGPSMKTTKIKPFTVLFFNAVKISDRYLGIVEPVFIFTCVT